ncbi:LGFP repeat-containing protein, partial [Mariniluteicoccus endophyticus]
MGAEFCGLRDGGCGQKFQGGSIYWSPAGGARVVWGEILRTYEWQGWERGPLAYPVDGEFCGLRDGGCGQAFQGGFAYWSAGSGSAPVWGEILGSYRWQGYEAGPLRFPVGAEFCGLRDGGCGQRFQGGYDYWSAATGAHPVWGLIGVGYGVLGSERSGLRYPTGAEFCGLRDGGCAQRFQGGLMYWSPGSGAHAVW